MTHLIVLILPLVIILMVASRTFGVNQEYQRAVLFRLGRLGATKGPGGTG
jgi:regulator of protease activity HflC (stomatin/prohibitin superfamily)